MAIMKDGPNGSITGKFGSVYAYVLNGQNIVRGARRKRTSPPTAAEILNRKKTKVTNLFLRTIFPIVHYGYKNLLSDHPTKNTANLAQSHVRKECIAIDENNEPYVRAELFKPFRGTLPSPKNTALQYNNAELNISWDNTANVTDDFIKLNVLLYKIDEDAVLKTGVTTAGAGHFTMSANSIKSTPHAPIHVYIGFVDSYSSELSDSVYLGTVNNE